MQSGWSGQDDPNGSGIQGYNIFVSVDGGAFIPWLEDTAQTTSFYLGSAGHTYSFTSQAIDNVGNVEVQRLTADTQITVKSAVAVAAPTGLSISPDTGSSSTDGVTDTGSVTLTGSLAAAGLTVDVFDATTKSDLGDATVTGTTFSLPLQLAVGVHQLRITAIDSSNNPSPPSTFTVDVITTPPAAPTNLAISPDTGVSSTDGLTDTGSLTLTGSLGAAGLTADVFDAITNVDLGAATVTGTSFSLPLSLAPGTHQLLVTATDLAGNTSSPSLFTVIVDETLPTATPAVVTSPRKTSVNSENVTFSKPINPATLTWQTLSLTLNGGPNLITSSNITITPVAGTDDAYTIGGLGALTTTDGSYVLTLQTGQITDLAGNAGTGTATTTWLIDTLKPTSQVSPLPHQETLLNGHHHGDQDADPAPAWPDPSGIASYDLYVSDNGGPFAYWTTVPASNATATYPGPEQPYLRLQQHRHRCRRSERREQVAAAIEASTYVPDLTPPATQLTSVVDTAPTFVVSWSGTDTGSSGLASFALYVQVDLNPVVEVGVFPAAPPNSSGISTGSTTYQAITERIAQLPLLHDRYQRQLHRRGGTDEPEQPVSASPPRLRPPRPRAAWPGSSSRMARSSDLTSATLTSSLTRARLTAGSLLASGQIQFELVQHQLDGVSRSTRSLDGDPCIQTGRPRSRHRGRLRRQYWYRRKRQHNRRRRLLRASTFSCPTARKRRSTSIVFWATSTVTER